MDSTRWLGLAGALVLAASCAGPGLAAGAGVPARFERSGGPDDFQYFAGGWTTVQRRLATRGVGAGDWETFPGTLCMTPYLEGRATVDELVFPTRGWAGLTLRTWEPGRRRWAVYWVSSRTGALGSPVVGGFDGPVGEFYGTDEDGGRPVLVRYAWTKVDPGHARWEQAFSYDGGGSWEVNWTADFTRADAAVVCEQGRPRR